MTYNVYVVTLDPLFCGPTSGLNPPFSATNSQTLADTEHLQPALEFRPPLLVKKVHKWQNTASLSCFGLNGIGGCRIEIQGASMIEEYFWHVVKRSREAEQRESKGKGAVG